MHGNCHTTQAGTEGNGIGLPVGKEGLKSGGFKSEPTLRAGREQKVIMSSNEWIRRKLIEIHIALKRKRQWNNIEFKIGPNS
jgi:hypothetical protein